jgi:thioredoxin-like negative regulator of GroEL
MRKGIIAACCAALVASAGATWAGDTKAPLSTKELKETIGAGGKATIVFFQNPNGMPCRAQKEIIERLARERKVGFNVANVSTMRAEDQKGFYEYGVRSLPTLALVDSKGRLVRVFPPGIQSRETLSAALDGLK